MKEILDEESKNALINYRIQRAYELSLIHI